MKRAIASIFVLLALLFCSRDIIVFATSLSDSTTYLIDAGEEESPGENKSKDNKEKDDIDEWLEAGEEHVNYSAFPAFKGISYHHEKRRYTPYFEIPSPPPERF